MAVIKVYYRDMLKDEVQLDSDVTTIGRSFDSDIIIDNAGVSAHHARIVKKGDEYIIEDHASRNGVFINGKRITSQPLNFNDDVVISKHVLRLTAVASGEAAAHHQADGAEQFVQGATMEVDVSNLGDLMKQRQARIEAHLLMIGATDMRSRYPLNKLSFTIGKARNADLFTPGWFAPKQAAQIVRKNDGFYIMPKPRGKVRVNNVPVQATLKLDDGDAVSVRNLMFKFIVKKPDNNPTGS